MPFQYKNTLRGLISAVVFALAACNIVEPGTTYSIPRAVPNPVIGANGMRFTWITSGFFHSCALDAAGRAWCWGDNQYRQTGQTDAGAVCDQTSTCTLSPAPVETALRFTAISAGVTQTCAIAVDGSAWCWGGGYDSGRGILGDGKLTQSAAPVAVQSEMKFKSISVGGRLVCALSSDGRVFCWGAGGYVGDGSTATAFSPVEIAGNRKYVSIAVGVSHGCAVTAEHEMYCWGSNQLGELGIGHIPDALGGIQPGATSPVRVNTSLSFQSVTAGGNDTCGLTVDGTVACWGDNHVGELGSGEPGPPQSLPVSVVGGIRFASVAAGTVHTCGLSSDGMALCWGGNWFGGLGDGTSSAANTGSERGLAKPVKTSESFLQIAPGGSHTCALARDSRVWCWGDRARGQMGDGRN